MTDLLTRKAIHAPLAQTVNRGGLACACVLRVAANLCSGGDPDLTHCYYSVDQHDRRLFILLTEVYFAQPGVSHYDESGGAQS